MVKDMATKSSDIQVHPAASELGCRKRYKNMILVPQNIAAEHGEQHLLFKRKLI